MRTVAALCLAVLALAGCGAAPRDSAKDFKGADKTVAGVVEALEKAGRDNDPTAVCTKLLATKLLAALKQQGTNCKTGVKEAFKDADSFDLTVQDVSISGATATAKVKYRSLKKDRTAALALDDESGSWKISSLGSTGS